MSIIYAPTWMGKPLPVAVHKPLRISMRDTLQEACDQCGLTVAEMMSDARPLRIARPRQEAMYLMWRRGHSQSAIGRFMGRDHSTVNHAIRAVENRLSGASWLDAAV